MVANGLLNGNSHKFEEPRCDGVDLQAQKQVSQRRVVLKFGGTVCGRLPIEVADICLYAALANALRLLKPDIYADLSLLIPQLLSYALQEAGRPRSREPQICKHCDQILSNRRLMVITSSLLKAARAASKPGSSGYNSIVKDILRQHIDGTKILSTQRAARLVSVFTHECDKLLSFLADVSKREDAIPEIEDRVVCVGEQWSTQLMAALLEDKGTPAEYVDLSDIVDFDAPHSLTQSFYESLSKVIGRRIEDCGDKVPVGSSECFFVERLLTI